MTPAAKIRSAAGHPDPAERGDQQQRDRAGQQLGAAEPGAAGRTTPTRSPEATSTAPPANAYGSA